MLCLILFSISLNFLDNSQNTHEGYIFFLGFLRVNFQHQDSQNVFLFKFVFILWDFLGFLVNDLNCLCSLNNSYGNISQCLIIALECAVSMLFFL